MAEVPLPQLGETVTEGTITRWFKNVGDTVAIDEILYEVSTDKVDSEVPSPVAGVISEILVPEGETIDVGTVLAIVADSAAAPESTPPPVAAAPPPPTPAPAPLAPDPVTPAAGGDAEGRLLSPVVRRLIREHDLDPQVVIGTGIGGRITRKDVLDAIDILQRGTPPAASAAAPTAPAPTAPAPAPSAPAAATPAAPVPSAVSAAAASVPALSDRSEFVPFNNIRRRTGEHMVHSVTVAPHALTVMEVDYENVERVRRVHKTAWKAEEGSSLTYLPFIMRAVVDALADWPHLNASVEGDESRLCRVAVVVRITASLSSNSF